VYDERIIVVVIGIGERICVVMIGVCSEDKCCDYRGMDIRYLL